MNYGSWTMASSCGLCCVVSGMEPFFLCIFLGHKCIDTPIVVMRDLHLVFSLFLLVSSFVYLPFAFTLGWAKEEVLSYWSML